MYRNLKLIFQPQKVLKIILANFKYRFSHKYYIYKRRLIISNQINLKLNGIVKYGPFKGFKIGSGYDWGKADIGNMLLGLYEKEVLEVLQNSSKSRNILIDIGAADGYFAIGTLFSRMFNKTICFEISESSQKNLLSNAKLNNVSNKIEIHGDVKLNFDLIIKNKNVQLSDCVILCDIEGGEFNLFSDINLESLKDAILIVEIHDWHFNGKNEFENLLKRSEKYFNINFITTKGRDLSIFPELKDYNDNDRWLICSEGRHKLMTWLYLTPKK